MILMNLTESVRDGDRDRETKIDGVHERFGHCYRDPYLLNHVEIPYSDSGPQVFSSVTVYARGVVTWPPATSLGLQDSILTIKTETED